MKFGMNAFGLSPRHLPDVAALAEANGFDSVWIPEHLVFPVDIPPAYLYSADGFPPMRSDSPAYDPWILLATVAAKTTTIRVGTNVFILPLRHPINVARSVVTLDRVSGGRVNFGVGVGWMREEFEAVGQDFSTRGRRTDEIIPLLRRLWSEDVIEHHGPHYDILPVTFEPKPLQKPSIPIYIGGTSPAALERAARLGDGWMAHRSNIVFGAGGNAPSISDYAELGRQIAVINDHRREAGRADSPFEIRAFADDLSGVRQCQDLGVTGVNSSPPTNAKATKDSFSDWIKQYADEVIANA